MDATIKQKLLNIDRETDSADGRMRFLMTSDALDRDGEVVDPDGMLADSFMRNPVFLYGHDSYAPPMGRIVSLTRTIDGSGPIHNQATLYHERCTLRVDWVTQHVDARLHRHGLVTIRHALTSRCADGALRIQRLMPADRPMPSINLFETVPPRMYRMSSAFVGGLPYTASVVPEIC